MYRNSTKDPLVSVVTAAMGAGTIAAISVSRGQDLLVGIGVTIFATVAALVIDQLFFE
ncbi:MAG: hypothetical protein LDL47_01030 [Cyanobacteria bacterium KgW148]|nr:hypothetical protein [Cyanobacteria bacterium KgW148]